MTLEDLPEEFGQLQTLIVAESENCKLLRSLCGSFGTLEKLQKLNLRGCCRLIQ